MDKTISIGLTGHAAQFRLDQDAYDRLSRYLDQAARRLPDDDDRAEVLDDLERSIGDRLAALIAPADRLITAADIEDVLDEIGAVDTGREPTRDEGAPRRRRRLRRIRQGQEVAGVCTGIADYAEVKVDWVRWTVALASIFTGGIFILVYIALVLILPVDATPEG
jgi:phage shock protein PspC (stress-responsive transcriptional regulator)